MADLICRGDSLKLSYYLNRVPFDCQISPGVVLDTTSEGPHSLFVEIETCLSK